MRTTSDIVLGVTAQVLRHRVLAGRPTSATFDVFAANAGDDDEAEFSGTATVDPVTTTLSAAAGAVQTDPTAIALSSAAGVAARRRYLVSEAGRREWVQLVALDGATAYAAAPLQNRYTTAATFVSADLTAAVDATWVADEGNLSDPSDPDPDYRVRWQIVIGGETVIAYSFFNLLRGAVDHGVTMLDVAARLWNVIADIPIDDRPDQGERIIAGAWEDVQADLTGQRINDAALRDASLVDQLLMRRIKLNFAENGHYARGVDPAAALAYAQSEYQRFFERNFAVASSLAMATRSSGGADKGKPKRLWGA